MATVLRYGVGLSVPLELADGVLVADCGVPPALALEDPAAAVAAALAEPLDYPSLARSTTPGDRVVLALDYGVPQSAEILTGAIGYLVDCGVELDGITVLQTQADVHAGVGDPRQRWPSEWTQRITLLTHDPSDRGRLVYLATTEAGEAVLLNRALTDADVVLPIGCVRCAAAAGYYGIHSPLFPTFSDPRTLARFRSMGSLQTAAKCQQRLLREVEEVAWLLGVTFTIQVVPAGGDRILHVLAGQSGSVRLRSRELYSAAWDCSVPRRASLVVAAIEGSAGQQTWQNMGRALAAAVPLVEDGGAIALCCGLADKPGPAVQCLADSQSRDAALRRISKDRPADTLPAAQLAQALEQSTVYLLSGLDESLVEQLDMAPVAGADELLRLVRLHKSCILLGNAPYVAVTVHEKY